MSKPTISGLQKTITDLKRQLTATQSLVRMLRKQNDRIAKVNVDLIKELHEFAMKYGGE